MLLNIIQTVNACVSCFTVSLSPIFCGINQDSGSATTGVIKQIVDLTDEENDEDDGVIEDVTQSKKRSNSRRVNLTALPINPFSLSYNALIFAASVCQGRPWSQKI